MAVERLALTAQGQVRYRLKTPYRGDTSHIVLEPLDFMARLAALVPPPRKHLTRFHHVAMILRWPLQRAQSSISMPNTRLSRRAQLIAIGRGVGDMA